MLIEKPHRFPIEGNPLYPLPAHYNEIKSPEEQQWCRLNALSLQETPEDLVCAWSFFRTYYLRQLPEGFFYKRFFESPPFHYQIIEDVGRYTYNAVAAPRGFSKSTILAVELPLFLALTRQNFHTLLVLSVDRMVNKRIGAQISRQILENPYILADFGEMKPSRGAGTWSAHLIQLKNGSYIEGIAVKGRMQGPRPDLILADDVEFDPVLNQENPELTENYANLLTEVLMPMLDGFECGLYWIGTLLSKACFLYHVVTTQDDERFLHWNRRFLDAEDDGAGGLLWETKFSRERLDREREQMGVAAYNKNRRNRPGEGGGAIIQLHPDLNNYEISGDIGTDPFTSNAQLISWKKVDGGIERLERPLRDVLANCSRMGTFDWASCLTPTSDFIAFSVVAIEYSEDYPDGAWWHLDLHLERETDEHWLPAVFKMTMFWRLQRVGAEAVLAQETIAGNIQRYFAAAVGDGWMPSVEKITYPSGLSKEARMMGLAFRYREGVIKLPLSKRMDRRPDNSRTPYGELIYEIENFTGTPGATQKDDAHDGLAMIQYMFRGDHHVYGSGAPSKGEINLTDALKRGDKHIHSESMGVAIPTILGLAPGELTMPMVREALAASAPHEQPRRVTTGRGPRIVIRRRGRS